MIFSGYMHNTGFAQYCIYTILLGHMVILFLVFKGISILLSIVAVSVYIPTKSSGVFPFLHVLSSIYCLQIFLMMDILMDVRLYLIVVLICISLIMMLLTLKELHQSERGVLSHSHQHYLVYNYFFSPSTFPAAKT